MLKLFKVVCVVLSCILLFSMFGCVTQNEINVAYDEGFTNGQIQGYKEGLLDGETRIDNNACDKAREIGYDEGYRNGYDDGKEDWYKEGYKEGCESGEDSAIEKWSDEWGDEFYDVGYYDGYWEGRSKLIEQLGIGKYYYRAGDFQHADCFHQKGCPQGMGEYYYWFISRDEAVNKGLIPCSVCNP